MRGDVKSKRGKSERSGGTENIRSGREENEKETYFKHSRRPHAAASVHVLTSHSQPFSCAYLTAG